MSDDWQADPACGCDTCERVLQAATIADMRDRLRIMAPMVCEGCGCAPLYARHEHCLDCWEVRWNYHGISGSGSHVSSCISVGLRALCGRRILEGC